MFLQQWQRWSHLWLPACLVCIAYSREALLREKCFLSGIARITSPQFGQLVPLFLDVKNDVLARITHLSNDDYDHDGSDNCDTSKVYFRCNAHIDYREETVQ